MAIMLWQCTCCETDELKEVPDAESIPTVHSIASHSAAVQALLESTAKSDARLVDGSDEEKKQGCKNGVSTAERQLVQQVMAGMKPDVIAATESRYFSVSTTLSTGLGFQKASDGIYV